jgi:tripartite-type tricarboxylate transporter receptor subunit TctC
VRRLTANAAHGRRWNAINAPLYDKLSFNFIRDIVPVAGIMRVPGVMVVNPWVAAKTIPEFIAYLGRAGPREPPKMHGIWGLLSAP